MIFEPRPFGKYFLTDRIAVGGMAEIFKAKTFGVDGFEKTLAIKKILANYSADKDFVTMLTDEAKLVVNLSHPNIVQVYDLGRVGDDYYLSMEFIDGVNLRELINRGQELNASFPAEICLYIAAEICKGLDHAHVKRGADGQPLGIVHRDISPHNILVSFDGEVKIVDFGIAKAAMNVSQTLMGTLKGKVTYMSPEQALGKPFDHRTDIFSLGIVLFEMITGERLFTGDSQMEVLNIIRSTRITEDWFKGKIQPEILKPLARALAYNPRERYQSAADMQVELTRLLYTRHRDFTPRRLADLLKSWYSRQAPSNGITAVEPSYPSAEAVDIEIESPAPSAGTSRDNIMLPETLKAGEVSSADFLCDPPPADDDEPTELSQAPPKTPAGYGLKQKLALGTAVLALLTLAFAGIETWLNGSTGELKRGGSANIRLNSNPSGARIYLDGEDTELGTPALLRKLKLGQEYEITLVKEGHEAFTTKLLLESPKPLPLVFPLARLDERRQFSLTVRSVPEGAAIVLNGRDTREKTPHEFAGLNTGRELAVALKLNGYQEYRAEVDASGGRDQIVDVALTVTELADVTLDSDPTGAVIVVNGKATSYVTPYVLSGLSVPQVVEFRFRLEGYVESVETVGLTEPGSRMLKIRLTKDDSDDGDGEGNAYDIGDGALLVQNAVHAVANLLR